jgi:5-methylthioribose kinase
MALVIFLMLVPIVKALDHSIIRSFLEKHVIFQQKSSPFHHTLTQDIVIEEISLGITNYCFKIYDGQNTQQAVFLKHSKDYIRGWSNISLTSDRLRYEHDGILAFSKYASEYLPKILVYDDQLKFLVFEWLEGYTNLRDCFISGNFDASYARKMGTLMGRSHGNEEVYVMISNNNK